MNEAQTKHDLIEPALRKAGWGEVDGSYLRLEHPINKGRLIGQNRRKSALFADYAERLNIRFCYATNGSKIQALKNIFLSIHLF